MSRGFWATRRLGWVVGGALLAVVSLTVWLFRAKSGVNAATILSLTVSIASLGLALWGLRPIPQLSRVARDLAGRVAQERGQARRQALGMSADARPAETAFRSPLADDEPELVRWRSDGGSEHGTLRDVAHYYRSLERGRIVVLGAPGAGKTVLASQLVIDLAEDLPDGELQPAARPPVPVWLNLPSLDLGEPGSLDRLSAEELATRLDEQIAAQISEDYQILKPTAQRLLAESWILPVLDGLDEMDTYNSEADDARPLAAAVVRALNAGTGKRPVVLVCRRAEYGQMARSSTVRGEDPVLQDATQIILQPLNVIAICDFLARRFPGRRPGELDARWEDVRQALQDTNAMPQTGSLTEVLSSPWQLFLATAAYHDDDTDPAELTRLPADKIGEHLLVRLIPALTHRTPRPDGDYYSPSDVRTWLGALASHLKRTSEQLGWSPTDLRLERLWPIGGQKTVRRLSVLATTMIISIATTIFYLASAAEKRSWYLDTRAYRIGLITGFICASLFCIYMIFYVASDIEPTPNRLDLRLDSSAKRRKLAVALAVGLALGLALGLAIGAWGRVLHRITAGTTFGIAGGLAGYLSVVLTGGLAYGLVWGLRGNFSLAERPSSLMRQNIAYSLVTWLAFGLVLGVAAWRAGWGVFGLAAGLALGLIAVLANGLTPWIRYLIGCSLARRQSLLPRHVGRFLDWAYQANLLRMSGTAIQFRHRELQAWLTAPAHVVPAPATSADPSRSRDKAG